MLIIYLTGYTTAIGSVYLLRGIERLPFPPAPNCPARDGILTGVD